jgi:alpha-2-macroglobulin
MARKIVLLCLAATLILSAAAAFPPQSAETPYEALKREGERYYAEKSFSRAHEVYQQAAKLDLPELERRWVTMRIAASALRAAISPTAVAQATLDKIVADPNHDRVWAEANEALGDARFDGHGRRDLHGAISYFTNALDWWAGSSDLELARRRYLEIFWKIAGDIGNVYAVPRELIVNAVTIARTPEDRAHARFLLATQLQQEGQPESLERALEHYEAIIAEGKKTEWYDDALFGAAQLLSQERIVQVTGSGEIEYTSDYVRALEYLRRIVNEFTSSQTRYHDNAEQLIRSITTPEVGVGTTGTFLPESEQQIAVSWRNVDKINLAIYAVELTSDAAFRPDRGDWTSGINITGKTPVRTWTFTTPDRGPYRPGVEQIRLEPRLAPGAYVVTASAPGDSARQLILVTDAHVLTHSIGDTMQVFVSDVLTGAPIANANVAIWQQKGREAGRRTGQTGADGLAKFTNTGDVNGAALVLASAGKSRQAWVQTYHYWSGRQEQQQWRIYAFTDRPAYRPNETVQWKIIARTREGGRWSTPANQSLDYEITDPRGQKVSEGKAALNAFGSFWAELPLTPQMTLGQYNIVFKATSGDRVNVGYARLFRLEEYKLPEFQVSVSTPEGKQYRLGETIEANIEATYYFGGPVANATVEAVIYEQPFFRPWYPWRKYPWYFQDAQYYGRGQNVVRRETLTTDAAGRATLRIETSRERGDMTYRIEARVVDASRREVRGEGTVRVTRQRYSVYLSPEHMVHRPGEQVSILISAIDANDKPLQVSGTVTVLRRTRAGDEDATDTKVSTNAEGKATFTFTPKREGHYVVRWRSEDGDPNRPARARDIVTAETAVWVAERRTTDLGFHSGGLDLVVDKESFRAGEKVSAIIVTPASGRWVVVTASGDGLYETQVVHLDGTAKLVEFSTDERHSPNFFITASSIFDRQIATDTERVVVPPVEHFLNVEVKSDSEDYRPRGEAQFTITTRDADGKPVPAEVALSVSDEAVTAIQTDPAGDPRPFFFGEIRGQQLQVAASLHSQRYMKLIVRNGRLVDADAVVDREEKDELGRRRDGYVVDGMDYASDMAMPAPPPAPTAPPSLGAVAEAITVTASAPQMAKESAAQGGALGQMNAQIDVQVRSDFRSTAFWKPDIVTNANGTATVAVKFPEALTTWRATARAVSAGTQVGMASDTARTNLPLIVRLQAPRFFVVGDRTTISAVVNNNTDQPMLVAPSLEVKGLTLRDATHAAITVTPHGEARADWVVTADVAGQAMLRVAGRGTAHGDAMEKTFIVYEHGIDKLIARSGKLRADEALVKLDLPRARRATELVVNVSPTLAATMIEALPYLVEFPYGCTEQTMSRFLPAAVVAKTGLATGIKNLDAVTTQGMARLYDMQHGNGAWGWWKEGPDDDFMTAYVVWGFSIARDAGLPVRTAAIDRAATYLQRRLVEHEGQWNDVTWILHALAAWRKTSSEAEKKAFQQVWAKRELLTSYSRALLALTAHRYGFAESAAILIRNLEDGVKVDSTPDQSVLIKGQDSAAETMATAHWGSDRFWWRWHEGPIESTAFALQALVTIQPDHKLIEPAMNWLIKNRRGAQWSNTRDTAIAVLAINDYLKASGELKGDVAFEVAVNGQVLGTGSATKKFTVEPSLLKDTMQEIRIRRTSGKGPVYFSAEARFVSLEEPVTAAGNELFVRREYYRLAPRPTLLKGVLYDKVPVRDGDSINSGERVEVVISVETKNDYSYLIFEDLKPAGLEAVELQSGQSLWATAKDNQRSAFIYQELRDRKVALFANHLQQGIWEIRYTLRAEVPGTFHALPVLGQAMYVPDIRANGDEIRVTVTE